jgi:hypothetical protein
MDNYKYIYKRPMGLMYKLSKKELQELLPDRQLKFATVELYLTDRRAEFMYLTPTWVKIAYTMLSPINLLFYGLSNIDSLKNDWRDKIHCKERGAFLSDVYWQKHSPELLQKIQDFIKINNKTGHTEKIDVRKG